MELSNQTPWEACLIHGPQGPKNHGVCVIVKKTLSLTEGRPPGFVWPVSRKDLKTDYGTFPFDHHFPIAKMDLMVCGNAVAPRGQPARGVRVDLQVGAFRYTQEVYGSRTWRKKAFGYKATDPEPFSELPLTLTHAYGGKAVMPFGEVPCPENPDGMGFLMKGQNVEGVALPHIERPDQRLEHPFATVRPTCMAPYPLGWKLRLDPLMEGGQLRPFSGVDSHYYFGQAHPDLMIDRVEPGTSIRLAGVHAHKTLETQVPQHNLEAEVQIDGQNHSLSFSLDGLCVFAHQEVVGYKYRAATTFPLEPRQQRQVILREVIS